MRFALLAFLLAALPILPAAASDRQTLGHGRLFTNDFLGDGEDRWRTGSYAVSRIKGQTWDGTPPSVFGELLEYRLRSEIIAPENLTTGSPTDRRYVGALSFGVHTHFSTDFAHISLGADLVVTGPQTGIGDLQTEIHELIGAPVPGVLGNQIGDAVYPTVLAEIARPLRFSDRATFRPFLEAQAGVETFIRVGGDFILGQSIQSNMMLRDVVSGQLYTAVRSGGPGTSFTLGGDIAHIFDSKYLPDAGLPHSDTRKRLRAGMVWQGEKSSVFYGVTWLGEEFQAQPESQIVGSVQLNIEF